MSLARWFALLLVVTAVRAEAYPLSGCLDRVHVFGHLFVEDPSRTFAENRSIGEQEGRDLMARICKEYGGHWEFISVKTWIENVSLSRVGAELEGYCSAILSGVQCLNATVNWGDLRQIEIRESLKSSN